MAEKTGQTGPKKGDKYRCTECGMEVQLMTDCKAEAKGGPKFQCCGKDLQKV